MAHGPLQHPRLTLTERLEGAPVATIPDLTVADTWTDADLDQLRVHVLQEQERRARVAAAPAQLADLTRSAIASGCNPQALVDAVTDAATA